MTSAETQNALRAALAHQSRREWAEARTAMAAAARAALGDPAASAAVADVYSRLGEYALAFELYDRAIAMRPNDSRYWFNRAAVRRFLGQLSEAESDYDRCIALDPSDVQAYLNRADLRIQTPERNHIARLEQMLSAQPRPWQAEVPLRYALAKEYEDLGQYARSWEQLAAGAALRRHHLQYDLARDLATVDWLIEAFPTGAAKAAGADSREPIFIVGMPRSGSTLVERMLGSHSQVFAAGELPDFGLAVVAAARERLGREGTRRELIASSAHIDPAQLAADYLDRTRAHTGKTPRFTDKLPLNYLYCGLIQRALPQARIVHVTRQPLATCYGVFKVLFEQGYPFSYDLAEIGAYYLGYRRLMAHWEALMPGQITEISYERLVANPEREARRLLTALELPWEASCLEFYRNPAPASTASASQVRRPIYSSSLAQWQHYATQLEPLRQQLETAGIACNLPADGF